MVDQCSREIRTLSHLLHPPLLDELGLISALRWFAKGFAERSGIHVDLDLPPQLGRLPQDLEIALFRIVQESLSNIHRHSGSSRATIRIVSEPNAITLEVGDEGIGFSSTTLDKHLESAAEIGIGIVGMRERVTQLKGRLEITGEGKGTVVRVFFPLEEEGS